jgi:hypothetical protein
MKLLNLPTTLALLYVQVFSTLPHSQICLWVYSPLLDLGCFFNFLSLYTDGRTPWTGDQPVARPLLTYRTAQTEHTHTYIHALSGIRTYDPSVRVSEDCSCLGPHGHCDRPRSHILYIYIYIYIYTHTKEGQ